MATSLRVFRIGLYEEHLEEGSFLYDQRRVLHADPEISWFRLGDFEQRLEAHIDALVLGGDLALEISREHAVAGDPGELFIAVCVFCRHALAPLLAEILRGLDYEDPDRVRAVRDALKYELPESWREHCLRAVGQGPVPLTPLLATVIGYRRLRANSALLPLFGRVPAEAQSALLWAVGRTREDGALDAVRPFYHAADKSILSTALRTGLRLQDSEALDRLNALAGTGQCLPIELALAGGRSAVPILLALLHEPEPNPDVITALGLLGDLSAVRPLIQVLSVESRARAAAEALHVITGAPLFEDVLVPEQLTEDELFDKELRSYRETGQLPQRGDGIPFGTKVHGLSLDPAVWQAWLHGNTPQFKADRRYRSGRPCSPAVLLGCLVSETFSKAYRGLVAEELLVRYGIDLPFEADMPVAAQQPVLKEAALMVGDNASAFEAGRWYAFARS